MNYFFNRLNNINRLKISDIILIMFLILLFFDLGILSSVTDKHYFTVRTIALVVICNSLFLILLSFFIIKTINDIRKRKIRYLIFNNPVLIVLFLYAVVKIFYIDAMLRWDGAWYFCRLLESVENFNFTFSSFLNNFNWYGHPSMGYAFLMSFGQFLDFGNHYLLNIENLILALASILLFYKIVTYLYKYNDINTIEILLLTTLFAFNPLYFGVSLSFNLDFPILVFWLASLCALLYNRIILFALFGTILVFSKETGALMYFTFLSFTFLFHLVNIFQLKYDKLNSNTLKMGFQNIFSSKISILYSIVSGILFLFYLIYSRGKLWKTGSLTWNNAGLHSFGFNWSSFTTRLFEIFILNFNWIQTFIILIFFMKIFFIRKNKFYDLKNNKNILIILLLVFIVFIAFNLFFITYNHPRYILPSVFFLLIFSHYALINILKKSNIRILILSVMIILSTIQIYRTFDPLSKMVFKTANFGEHQILDINPADGLVYNAEYTVIEKLLNQTNKEININENSSLILSDLWAAHINGDRTWSVINVDKANLKRTFKKDNVFQPKIYLIWDINQNNKPKEAYYIYMWFGNKKAELEHLQKYYKIINEKIIENNGYYLYLYKLEQL